MYVVLKCQLTSVIPRGSVNINRHRFPLAHTPVDQSSSSSTHVHSPLINWKTTLVIQTRSESVRRTQRTRGGCICCYDSTILAPICYVVVCAGWGSIRAKGITTQLTMFDHVLANLSQKITTEAIDLRLNSLAEVVLNFCCILDCLCKDCWPPMQ